MSRQTIYAIEAGTYIPNTAVSLKLARALESTVEEIFQIAPEPQTPDEILEATLIGDCASMVPGQPLRLCRVDDDIVGVAFTWKSRQCRRYLGPCPERLSVARWLPAPDMT
jgi:DNA-binding XRE family transcriptional regulator